MNSKERIQLAIDHKEPDRIPFDLGGTGLTLIHHTAYRILRQHLNLPPGIPHIAFMAEQLVAVEEDMADLLETDARLVAPNLPSYFDYVFHDQGEYVAYTDEWNIGWRMPKNGGFYFDMYKHPLVDCQSVSDMKSIELPDPLDFRRFQNLRRDAFSISGKNKAVVLASLSSGILEIYSWMRGYEPFYIDLAVNHDMIAYMLDRIVELKCAYWERALSEVGDLVDVVIEADDLAGQKGLLFSPRTYRQLVLPRHKKLFQFIKDQADVKLFFHSCGAVRPLIGDLIDAGIDILNPVQISAAGMDPHELKAEFGKDLVFWGGGVDTQYVLGSGTPEQVRDNVKQNIEALAPGGGFVFAAVHDIQANVPPENIMAMWQAWKENSVY